ncbi:M23 family metallopeptidase [Paraflavitalea soli]|nr:M23 family metallopeptidase [Paraflavitalea soli]
MKFVRIRAMLLGLAVIAVSTVWGQQQQPKEPLEIKSLFNPQVVLISGKPTMYYELHLLNSSGDSLFLQSLYIANQDSAWLRIITKDDLWKRYGTGKKTKDPQELILPPHESGILYVEMKAPGNKAGALLHQLTYTTIRHPTAGLRTASLPLIRYEPVTPLVIGPPLREGAWAAVYDPAWERGHRRVVYAPDGQSRIPGRFAIDFIKMDEQGKYASGDENDIKNWLGYGATVIAVADGVVASTLNDFPESKTLSAHPSWPSEKATGNYISLDIGNGHFAFYEHLQPGSIKVKPGQKVKKGDPIAALGFTGQTTGPHLHFHIANSNSPLGAEGMPFAFKRFTLLGSWSDFSQFGKAPWIPAQKVIVKERPAPNAVIRFQP